jgi:hypothetical protein
MRQLKIDLSELEMAFESGSELRLAARPIT